MSNIDEIEKLFISKLSEKYSLTLTDMKKAFGRFDRDGSGELDIGEMKDAIKLFLNGIDDKDITSLVRKYDTRNIGLYIIT